MNPQIFREYDIRGIAGEDLDENDVMLIGKGVGTYLKRHGKTAINVGRDCRLTSDHYTAKVIEGLTSTGCHVTDIGVCATPILYFSIHHFAKEGGVMVTASHNPGEYNGFKLSMGTSSIHGEQIQEVHRLIEAGDFETGQGKCDSADAVTPYHAHLLDQIKLARPLRVGVDAGNGTAGVVAVPLMRELGCEVHDLYCEMDGTFPNHPADPTVAANLTELIDLVKAKKLDMGIGFDGDGDRIGVVDEKGDIIYGDRLMIIYAREILSRKPGATFVSEVKCSKVMYDDIEKHGGRAIMWKTGHSLIKAKMKEENAALAGEMSGHIFFADGYFGFDDATYAALRLMTIVAKEKRPLSSYLEDIPRTFNTPEIRVECPDEIKFDIVKKVTAYFKERYDVIDIDGVRVLFDDGWGLVRASNTQPALVLRFEAMTEERLEEIRSLMEGILAKMQET